MVVMVKIIRLIAEAMVLAIGLAVSGSVGGSGGGGGSGGDCTCSSCSRSGCVCCGGDSRHDVCGGEVVVKVIVEMMVVVVGGVQS